VIIREAEGFSASSLRFHLLPWCADARIEANLSMSRLHAESPRTRQYLLALVAILLLGLSLRVWFWHDQALAGSVAIGDEDEYYRGAIHLILRGDYYDDGQWLRPPMTSLSLAAAFAMFGINPPLALLFTSALSLLTVALVATLVRGLFRRDDYAIIAAGCAAIFLPFAAYASRLLSENLFILFVTLAFVLLQRARWRPRRLFGGGVAIALAILTRPVLLYAVPLLLMWAWWELRRFLPALRSFAWLALGLSLVIAPWTARNYAVYHQLVLVDTTGGFNFWFGTLLDPGEKSLQAYWNTHLPNPAQRQQAAVAQAFDNIGRAPVNWLARIRGKVVGLWEFHLRNLTNNSQRGANTQDSSVGYSFVADVEYVLLVVASLVGLSLSRREERSVLLIGWPIYMTALCAVTLGIVRLREPLMVSAIAYAAPTLVDPLGSWRRLGLASRGRQAFLTVGLAAFSVLTYSNVYPPFLASQFWMLTARVTGQEDAIQLAIAADGQSVFPYLALGQSDRARGDVDGALAAFNNAAVLEPQHLDVQAERISILRSRGDLASAHAAVQVVADDNRDNPQWYEWEWPRVPYWAAGHVPMGEPAVGVMRGVYPAASEEGTPFRWTLGRAQFRVANPGARFLILRIRADRDKGLHVLVDNEFLQDLAVTTTWAEYRLRLTKPAGPASLVELETQAQVVSVDEPYARGVAVAALELDR
jgi:4-amino-4-deoxy-L-arabinose transferase-like glycosyltransferase